MAAMTFDTLKFANTLKAAGVPDKQAEAEASAFAEVLQVNFKELATKADLTQSATELRREMAELRREMAEFRAEMTREFKAIRQEFKEELQKASAKADTTQASNKGEFLLLRWMLGAVITGIVGLLIRMFLYPVQH